MSFFTFNMSTSTQGSSTAKIQPDCAAPHLSHALQTNHPSATALNETNIHKKPTFDPEAPWFEFNGNLLADGASQNNDLPSFGQSTFNAGFTSNEDLRWILLGMNDRIATLEESTVTGSKTMNELGHNVSSILSRLVVIEGMLRVIEDLKQNLREFTSGLMPHILGVDPDQDLEKQGRPGRD